MARRLRDFSVTSGRGRRVTIVMKTYTVVETAIWARWALWPVVVVLNS